LDVCLQKMVSSWVAEVVLMCSVFDMFLGGCLRDGDLRKQEIERKFDKER